MGGGYFHKWERKADEKQLRNAAAEIIAGSGKSESEKTVSLECRFHDLRHTAMTRLLEAGIPYPVVVSMMGWSAATAIRMRSATGTLEAKPSAMLPMCQEE